jgi:predicted molibdopterin-dependent oxidoreductase YjgC
MGVCYGCMVTINGEAGVLACQTVCAKGMKVVTE